MNIEKWEMEYDKYNKNQDYTVYTPYTEDIVKINVKEGFYAGYKAAIHSMNIYYLFEEGNLVTMTTEKGERSTYIVNITKDEDSRDLISLHNVKSFESPQIIQINIFKNVFDSRINIEQTPEVSDTTPDK